MSDDELDDYCDMVTDDNSISDEQLRRTFDNDDDVIIDKFRVTAKMF